MAKIKPLSRREIAVLRQYLKAFPPLIPAPFPFFDIKRISKTLTQMSERVDFLEEEVRNFQEARNEH